VTDHAVQAVDDTSQCMNIKGISNVSRSSFPNFSDSISFQSPCKYLISTASSTSQWWSNLLWTSGGNLNLGKCFYYAFHPYVDFKTNSIKYKNISYGTYIKIFNQADRKFHHVQDLLPNNARRMLGVILAPDSDSASQMKSTILKAKELKEKFL
jgi:hypothetical protein